jgi:hypothetical protein
MNFSHTHKEPNRNRKTSIPLYVRIESLIRNRILNGQLEPGEKLVLDFNLDIQEKGFKNHNENTRLVHNGTFLDYLDLIPAIGYDPHFQEELNDNVSIVTLSGPNHAEEVSRKMPTATVIASKNVNCLNEIKKVLLRLRNPNEKFQKSSRKRQGNSR